MFMPYISGIQIVFNILQVERLEVGALVSIRGVGRTKIVKFIQARNKNCAISTLFLVES